MCGRFGESRLFYPIDKQSIYFFQSHTCQHLEIRNQDTFIIAPPPPSPHCRPKLPSNHEGSLDAENLGKKKIEAPKSTSHSYVQFGSIKKISSFFLKKRTGKIPTFVLNITLKQQYLPAETFRKSGRPFFRGFESQKSGLSR